MTASSAAKKVFKKAPTLLQVDIFCQKAESGSVVAVREFLKKFGGRIVNEKNSKMTTALERALAQGHMEIAGLLVTHGAVYTGPGMSFLSCIRKEADLDLLIKAGIDIHARDIAAYTWLMQATLERKTEIVRCLLERGASPRMANISGSTALHYAVYKPKIVSMLLAYKADVNARGNKDETPLMEAAGVGNVAATRILLEHGADVHARNAWGRTALHYASRPETIRLLISYGADVNAQTKDGLFSPLMIAAKDGRTSYIAALLAEGADPTLQDAEGKTALDHARLYQREGATHVLQHHASRLAGRNVAKRHAAHLQRLAPNHAPKFKLKGVA